MTKRLASADRRKTILDAASQLFASGGIETMTTAAIARLAEVKEPILYRHFSSKQDILSELLKSVLLEVGTALQDLAYDAFTPLDALKRISLAYPELAARHERSFKIINRALAEVQDEETRKLLRDHYKGYHKVVSEITKNAQNAGQIRKDVSAEDAAWHIIHCALGFLFLLPLGNAAHKRRSSQVAFAEAAISGLLEPRI